RLGPQDAAPARRSLTESPRQLARARHRLQSRRPSVVRLSPPLLQTPRCEGGRIMIHNGVLAALFGMWAIVLPTDLHVAQRTLLVACVVPLLRMGYPLCRKRVVSSRTLILGNGPIVSKLIEELESSPTPRYVLTGVLDNQPLHEDTRAAWLGRLD